MTGNAHRVAARATFDDVAGLYDEARPGYPAPLYDDLVALAGLAPSAHLLEIGIGTGHAAEPLARRGFRIDGIELGEQMAAVARRRLAAFPAVSVTVADFDLWSTDARFALVYAASAYHWLNPATRIQRIAALLQPGGSVSVFRNHHVDETDSADFNAASARVYARVLGPKRAGLPRPEDIHATEAAEWQASGLFTAIAARTFRWQQQLTAEQFLRALGTHSDHRLLPPALFARLCDGLRRLIDDEFGGAVLQQFVTLLQIAKKSD